MNNDFPEETFGTPLSKRTYTIGEFSSMVGLPASRIRFYDKYGVFKCHRNSSGYRYFTAADAFRANAFRILRGYGFTVEKAVELLNQKQNSPDFIQSLLNHQENLDGQIEQLKWQKQRLREAVSALSGDIQEGFSITNMENQLYVCASQGKDFSVSGRNAPILEVFADLIPMTSFARIIPLERLTGEKDIIIPNYVNSIPKSKAVHLGSYDQSVVKELFLGEVVHYRRKKTRQESLRKESYTDLFAYLADRNLAISGDIILFPTFLNLDGDGTDWENLYIPIKKY